MPDAAPRRCPGCRQLVNGRCDTCNPSWARKPASWAGSKRSDSRWRKVRAEHLADNPLCVTCGDVADTVDHKDGTDYETQRYDRTVLQSMCTPCHRSRTSKQGAAARSRKRQDGERGFRS